MSELERLQGILAAIQVKIDFQNNAKTVADNKLTAHNEDAQLVQDAINALP